MITAYKDPLQLKRLITALNDREWDFYIHVDKKSNFQDFSFHNEIGNISFTSERYNVAWGGYSQVKSILALLKEAIHTNIPYDRVVLLSGMDYPIYSNQKIKHEFATNPDKQYIKALNISKSNNKKVLARIQRYWFFDPPFLLKSDLIQKICRKVIHTILPLVTNRKKEFIFVNNSKWDIYYGSDYWSLTFDAAKHVYNQMRDSFELQNKMKTAFVPSEIFAHTIIMNSAYRTNTIAYRPNVYKGLPILTPLHHIIYKDYIKTFREDDYQLLINSGKMFARKCSTGISERLLEKLDINRSKDQIL